MNTNQSYGYYSYPTSNSFSVPYSTTSTNTDDRFFFAPFLFGGLAGTALGYGIANNQMSHQNTYYPVYPVYPIYQPYPTYTNSNYYYY